MPSSSVSTETPSHRVPSLDHFVTQWMSTVGVSAGQLAELVPSPACGHCSRLVYDREVPLLQRRERCRAGGHHGKVIDEVLAWRDRSGAELSTSTAESAAHNAHLLPLSPLVWSHATADGDRRLWPVEGDGGCLSPSTPGCWLGLLDQRGRHGVGACGSEQNG